MNECEFVRSVTVGFLKELKRMLWYGFLTYRYEEYTMEREHKL